MPSATSVIMRQYVGGGSEASGGFSPKRSVPRWKWWKSAIDPRYVTAGTTVCSGAWQRLKG
jgi:hypothetical protein